MNLKEVYFKIEEIANTPSTNDKIELLKEYLQDKMFRAVCILAYDKTKIYHIKKLPNVSSHKKLIGVKDSQIINKLNEISKNPGTPDKEKLKLALLSNSIGEEVYTLVRWIVGKNLHAGFSGKSLNKAYQGLINLAPYCRCSTYKKIDNIKFPAIAQEKADGMFSNCMINGKHQIRFTSRKGNIIFQLNKLKSIILNGVDGHSEKLKNKRKNKKFGLLNSPFRDAYKNVVIMGELLVTRNGKTLSRKEANGILNKCMKKTAFLQKNESIIFKIWDMVTLKEFYDGKSERHYRSRLYKCRKFAQDIGEPSIISVIDTEEVKSINECQMFYDRMRKEHKEGCIIKNFEAKWKDGTSTEMCKMKNESEAELRIVGWKCGKKDSKYELCLGSLICETECGKLSVSVGSGFSDKEREHDWDLEIGKIGSFLYESVISNTTRGKIDYSLYLPRFVEVRNDRDTADTLEELLTR
jgi:DNA ligase-1